MDLKQALKGVIQQLGAEKGSVDVRNADGSISPVIAREGTDNVPLATSDLIETTNLRGGRVGWECGHAFPARYDIVMYGKPFPLTEQFFITRPSCGECAVNYLRTVSIRCGRCGHVIMPEDPSSLYAASADFMAHPRWVTMAYGRVICCMRDLCVISTGLYAGEWTRQVFRPCYEGRTQNEEVARTGKAIFLRLPIRSE